MHKFSLKCGFFFFQNLTPECLKMAVGKAGLSAPSSSSRSSRRLRVSSSPAIVSRLPGRLSLLKACTFGSQLIKTCTH